MHCKPTILNIKSAARSRLFHIETVTLRFANGQEVELERIGGPIAARAVVVVPVLPDRRILFIREYAVGTHSYELGLPRGLVDHGESVLECSARELREEIGMDARVVEEVGTLSIAPSFMSYRSIVVLALGLYVNPSVGDEPEQIELVPGTWEEVHSWMREGLIQEARSLAALYLCESRVR